MAYDDDLGYGDDRVGRRSYASMADDERARAVDDAQKVRERIAEYAGKTDEPAVVESDLLEALGL